MNPQRLLLALAVANLGLFAALLARLGSAEAGPETSVLRTKALEIVDDRGRVRASLQVAPANATYEMPDGSTGYPETVILRLITADGKPRVKLTTSEAGSGLMLLGDSDTTQAILRADGAKTSLKLRDDESKQRVLAP
jgi:hypothetical protein